MEIEKSLLKIKWTKMKLIRININEWEIDRPDPMFRNKRDLSITSAINDPKIKENLLILYFSLMIGSSKRSNGKAIWNIGKIIIPQLKSI